ncbi:MAG: hypothetical protein GC154_08755 [bacterium]|nr:hypothetical protein [bacterium]
MSWYSFVPGETYLKNDVVDECLNYINTPGKVENVDEKRRYIEEIRNYPGEYLRFNPGSGWAGSPMNPKSWVSEDGRTIRTNIVHSGKSRLHRNKYIICVDA